MNEPRHTPEHLENVRRNRQQGSLLHLTSAVGGETQITIFDDNYSRGYAAVCVSRQMAAMVRYFLDSDFNSSMEVSHLFAEDWFPGTFGKTPFEALTNLSAKLDAMTIEQYADVFGAGMNEGGRTAWTGMDEIPDFPDFPAMEAWFWIK